MQKEFENMEIQGLLDELFEDFGMEGIADEKADEAFLMECGLDEEDLF